jgi:hypothetical protein
VWRHVCNYYRAGTAGLIEKPGFFGAVAVWQGRQLPFSKLFI